MYFQIISFWHNIFKSTYNNFIKSTLHKNHHTIINVNLHPCKLHSPSVLPLSCGVVIFSWLLQWRYVQIKTCLCQIHGNFDQQSKCPRCCKWWTRKCVATLCHQTWVTTISTSFLASQFLNKSFPSKFGGNFNSPIMNHYCRQIFNKMKISYNASM